MGIFFNSDLKNLAMNAEHKEDLLPEILDKVDQILTRLDEKSEWISGNEAARMLGGISYNHFINRRANEFISRKKPNGRTEFLRKSVEEVANKSIAS